MVVDVTPGVRQERPPTRRRKLRIPFFVAGVVLLVMSAVLLMIGVVNPIREAQLMSAWTATPATLVNATLHVKRGDDKDSYRAEALYSFDVNGETFTNDTVSLHGGSDNLGNYQRDLGRELVSKWKSGTSINVFYNPADPTQAIIDRSVRMGMLLFMGLFSIPFAVGGIFLIIVALRQRQPRATARHNLRA